MVEQGGTVVALVVADDRDRALEELENEHADADPGEAARELAEEVAARIESRQDLGPIPFRASGTRFQQEVWAELARTPRGEVVTYVELARRIGRPGAARAVGSACGANPVALLIPCHRVVASDGSLGGYRWGVGRKAQILSDEGIELAGPIEQRAA